MTHSDSRRRDVEILKRDARGRVRTSVRQHEAILDEFERSGLSGPKFSQVAGVCYQTLTHWMRKRRRSRGEYPPPAEVAARRGERGPALLRWVEAETDTAWGLSNGNGDINPGRETETKAGTAAARPLKVGLPGGVTAEVSHEGQLALVVELARRLNPHFAKPC